MTETTITIRETRLNLSVATLTTSEDGTTSTFTAALLTQPTDPVTVAITSSNISEGTVSPASLTFTVDNWQTAQTVTVTGQDDNLDDGDQRYRIELVTSSADPNYNTSSTITATNTDNDDAPTAITLTATPATITEAGGEQSINITATFEGGIAVTDTTTIALNFAGSASSTGTNPDYGITESAPTITIPAGATSGSTILTITPVADTVADDAETIIIDGSASGAITLTASAVTETTITIRETRLNLSVATLTTSEDGTTSNFTAALLTQPTDPVTVAITSSNISEGTVSPASLTFTRDNWQTIQTVTVTGQNDNLDDGDQRYSIELVTSSADSNYNTSSTITATNTDNDDAPTAITLTATPATITEAGGEQSINITATFEGGIAVTDTTTIALDIVGSATSTTDYGITESAPTITIPAGATTGSTTLTITPVADTVDDDAETIIIDGNASGAITLAASAVSETTITIRETGLNLSVADIATSENGTTSHFTAALLTQPTDPVTVAITSSNQSEGTVSPDSLTFTRDNWQTTQTVTVTGQNDNLDDGDQRYRIELVTSSADSNYNTSSTIPATNTDDDDAPTAITLTATPDTITEAGGTQAITITATFEGGIAVTDTTTIALDIVGSATRMTDYGIAESAPTITIPAGATTGSTTLTITPVADTVADDAETIIIDGIASGAITLAAVSETTITIRETGLNLSVATLTTSENGTTSHFTAALLTQPTDPVTVAITSSNISEGTVSPASLTFTVDNWQTAQTVTVTGQDDNLDDGDQRYRIELVTSSADPNYNTSSTITATNTDNDDAPTAITLTATPAIITEAGGEQSITITATFEGGIAVTDTTTIALNFAGSATRMTDYGITESAPTITIPAGATTGSTTLTITPVADTVADDAETIIIDGIASGAITLAAVSETTITIRETGLNLSVDTLITSEGGTASHFTAALLTQPTDPVTVAITSSNISEGTVSPASLTFTRDNWQTTQTVTVTGQDDNLDDGDQSYSIELTTRSDDTNYNTSSTITATNTDNDDAPTAITLTATPATITEAGGEQSINITATFDNGIAVTDTTTIALDIVGSATRMTDYGIAESAPTITIPARATTGSTTLTITPVADTVADDAETIIIDGNASGAITLTDSAVRKTTITIRETGLNLSVDTLITSEGGTASHFTAALLTQPTDPVTVAIISSNPSEGTVSPASLVFTVDNWQTTQTVTVAGQDDNLDDNDQSYRIELVTSSADSNYNTSSTITATNTDDDDAPTAITLTATPATITEAGGTQSITITATFEGGIAVTDTTTIALDIVGSATRMTDYGIAEPAPTITIPARATTGSTILTISPVADTVADDAETIIIDGNASGAITLAAVSETTITIVEKTLGDSIEIVNKSVLPHISQAIVASTLSSIEGRMNATRVGAPQTAGYNLNGQPSLLHNLQANAKAIQDGTFDWRRMMANSSFVLPLAEVAEGGGLLSSASLWADGHYSSLKGDSNAVDWDGDVFGLQIGADTRLRDDLLVGLQASLSQGDFDYTETSAGTPAKGEYNLSMTSLNPYMAWDSERGLSLWGSVGYGDGELEVEQQGASGVSTRDSSDVSQSSLAAGIKQRLSLLKASPITLSLKSDFTLTRTDIKGSTMRNGIKQQTLNSQRLRLLTEGEHERRMDAGRRLVSTVEMGMRYDSSNGGTYGVEMDVGLRYLNPAAGLTLEGRADIFSSDEYSQWGINGLVRLDPKSDGRGLAFSLNPRYGVISDGVQKIWQQKPTNNNGTGKNKGNQNGDARIDIHLGYGLRVDGLLTPYGEATLGNSDSYRLGLLWKRNTRFNLRLVSEYHGTANDYRLNLHWTPDSRFDFNLTGERLQDNNINHVILLKGRIRF